MSLHDAAGRHDFLLQTPQGRIIADDPLPGVTERTAVQIAQEHDSVVVGLLPFDPDRPPLLMVPRRWHRKERARRGDGPSEKQPAGKRRITLPHPLSARGADSPAYRHAVGRVLPEILDGRVEKVVLSRLLELDYAEPIPVDAVVENLLRQHPQANVFSVRDPHGAVHLGASPELVIEVCGRRVRTHPLAGSASRCREDATADRQAAEELMRSAKDRAEHAMVVQDIRSRLEPLCTQLSIPPVPSVVATPQLWHLGTSITGILDSGLTALDAARAIHPTPAICGTPRQAALEAICRVEPHDRAYFGGLVGWMAPDGSGEWVLNLRSARLEDRQAVLFAGAGIVQGSTPDQEHQETGVKLSTFLAALGMTFDQLPAEQSSADQPSAEQLTTDSSAEHLAVPSKRPFNSSLDQEHS